MDIEEFRDYCLTKKAVSEEFPFGETTLVFKVMGKMFALSSIERYPQQANLKCDPEFAIRLREEFPEDIIPGYHMNKKHWNTVFLNDSLPTKKLKELIDHSYDLVVKGLTKKLKQELNSF